VVLDQLNRILLVKEKGGIEKLPSGKEFLKPSKWGLPGGVKEDGEEEVDTAIREVKEESGIWIEIEPGIRDEKMAEDHINITLLGHPLEGKLKSNSSEIGSCRWFPLHILRDGNFDIYFSHRQRAQKILRKLKKEWFL